MSTLREIRRRIHSVENVEQITKAMEMVAIARLRRAQIKAEHATLYVHKLKQLLERLQASEEETEHPLLSIRKLQKIGVIVIAADKGLCGPYNIDIFKETDRFLETFAQQHVELIVFGTKAIDYYRQRVWKIRQEWGNWGGKITVEQMQAFSQQLINWYLQQELDEIWIVSTHFQTILSRIIVKEKLLGISLEKSATKPINYIFEPNLIALYKNLLPRYCFGKLQAALEGAYAAELATRAFSMRKATRNASEILEKLTLEKNKIRQTNITREMIEIASGAEGIK